MDKSITSYDDFAEIYCRYAEQKPFNRLYERPVMLERLPNLQGKTVLDAGSGTGFYALVAAEQGAQAVALDISPKMLQFIEKSAAQRNLNVQLVEADLAYPLPFVAEQFDWVICSLALHYVKDWQIPLNEFYRILQPGGRALISTHHPCVDYALFGKERYFETRLVVDQWNGFEPPIRVAFYVRPLAAALQAFLQSQFTIVNIEEPMPSQQCRQEDEELYQRLRQRPGFLFYQLKKPY